jgi:hypothetical protein
MGTLGPISIYIYMKCHARGNYTKLLSLVPPVGEGAPAVLNVENQRVASAEMCFTAYKWTRIWYVPAATWTLRGLGRTSGVSVPSATVACTAEALWTCHKETVVWLGREMLSLLQQQLLLLSTTTTTTTTTTIIIIIDRLCGLVVRVLGYRFGGLGSIPGTTKKSSGSGTGSTQPREYNWGATW